MPDDPLFGISQRAPPSNLQAEQALLGACLANNRAYDLVAEYLRPEHFHDPINGRIYQAMKTRIEAGHLADALTLKDDFENAGILAEVGGTPYLATLLASMVGIANAREYGRTIYNAWIRRGIIKAAGEAVDQAFGAELDIEPEAVITEAVNRMVDLLPARGGQEDWAGAIDTTINATSDAFRDGVTNGLLSGIATLDDLWRGMWPASLDILGARSEHGKSALGFQIAENVARSGHTVQIFSLEMKRTDIATRMLASHTGIPSDDLREGKLSDARTMALMRARADLRALPLRVNDKSGLTMGDIRVASRQAVQRHNASLIVIDHLHKIRPDKASARLPRLEQVQTISWALKELAKDLDVPILLLAQLSRQVERREIGPESQKPRVSDLRYAGEDDADNILLLWRPELYMSAKPPVPSPRFKEEMQHKIIEDWWRVKRDRAGKAEVIFAKRRFGPTAEVTLAFDGPRTRFTILGDNSTRDLRGEAEMPPDWDEM